MGDYQEWIGSHRSATPNQLYKATAALPNAIIIKDAGTKAEKKFIPAVTGGGIQQKAAERRVN